MERTVDVVVIGGGMAGVAAALAAAASGARVVVVRASPGVSAMTSGAWIGAMPDGIARALDAAGIRHDTCAHPLPHPSGELRACTWASVTHVCRRIDHAALVCGIAGLPGFCAAALARLWSADEHTAMSVTLELEGTPAAGWSPVALAAALDRDPGMLARPLAQAARARSAARIILPAVLGLERGAAIVQELRAATGTDITEALGSPPSVPGWRLGRALDAATRAAGIDVIGGRALRAGNGARRIDRIRVTPTADAAGGTAPLDIIAKRFVLATGKFAGGGIAADGVFRETALGCPVWIDHLGQRFEATHPLPLTTAERCAPQPILTAGVRADDRGRPLDTNDDVVYENVVLAGSVRAGVTTAQLGLGGAAEDGWCAGEFASNAAA
jgi:glycerol-3-phosphate dehydrogenase subunit B